MKRYVKIVVRDEHGRSEYTMRDASELNALSARRAIAQSMHEEPITDAEWAETVASAKEGAQ